MTPFYSMNTQLQKLFEKHDFSLKDCYEFSQLFSLLPERKQMHVLENFDEIAAEIFALRKDLAFEQGVILWKSLQNIEQRVFDMHKHRVCTETKEEIGLLRYMI